MNLPDLEAACDRYLALTAGSTALAEPAVTAVRIPLIERKLTIIDRRAGGSDA